MTDIIPEYIIEEVEKQKREEERRRENDRRLYIEPPPLTEPDTKEDRDIKIDYTVDYKL